MLRVPLGPIIGPILFNTFINDLLLFIKNTSIWNFANDTTLHACGKDFDTIPNKLELEINLAIPWIKDNEMVANPSKFHLTFLP